jgi:hypothetical protein
MAQIVNKCLLSGQDLFTCWPMIIYLLVKVCLLCEEAIDFIKGHAILVEIIPRCINLELILQCEEEKKRARVGMGQESEFIV